ncbi:MAG: RNA methyltransferase [Bacteroidota bacterium]
MLSANQQKFLTSLSIKKYRQKYRKFVVEGDKMVVELLSQQYFTPNELHATERWAEENRNLLRGFLDKFNVVTEAELKKISSLSTPNQVLAVVDMPDTEPEPALAMQDFCFFADGIQDPGNLGTLLRIADWFGMPAVFCAPDTVDAYSPKVIQASMGAFLRIKTAEIALKDLLATEPGLPVCGAVLGGENLFTAQLPEYGLLVIGREGRGVSAETERMLSHHLTIPKHPNGSAESLNAGVAAGILAAVVRNRVS